MDPPQAFLSPVPSWCEVPVSDSILRAPDSTSAINPSVPPWLHAPSSPPWSLILLAPPGSLVPPSQPWSGSTSILHPFGSTGLRLPSGSAIVLSRSGFTMVIRVPASALVSRTRTSGQLHLGPPDLQCHPSSVSPQLHMGLHGGRLCCRSLHSWSLLPGFTMAPPSCDPTLDHLARCGLGPCLATRAPGSPQGESVRWKILNSELFGMQHKLCLHSVLCSVIVVVKSFPECSCGFLD
ncbi:hypothetical protein DPX16_2534 [Anabarilius grahami]|uniref:Uncharacterized protein n=1 Tax=Anabarilius grahami TaxID=495550 RepID=A0A3N0XDX2_ANAGA|nr:hypothetical protein DPX16_2534 [Anabarilius grahami]